MGTWGWIAAGVGVLVLAFVGFIVWIMAKLLTRFFKMWDWFGGKL